MIKISKKWRRIAEIYKSFAKDFPMADFGEEAAMDMYQHENGIPLPSRVKSNGFQIGKRWMNVTVAMWKEDIAKGLLRVEELENEFPEWFLKNIGILKYRRQNG